MGVPQPRAGGHQRAHVRTTAGRPRTRLTMWTAVNRLVVDQSEARHAETVEEIGAYEAKTRLSELLARVSRGERITLTRRGVPVAMLVPVTRGEPVAEVVAELRAFRKGRRLGALSLRELIEAGRKW